MCGDGSALGLVRSMAQQMHEPLEVHTYDRFTPLQVCTALHPFKACNITSILVVLISLAHLWGGAGCCCPAVGLGASGNGLAGMKHAGTRGMLTGVSAACARQRAALTCLLQIMC